jgi:acetylornithine deacetylase/succinyl-diaminopimelate desuccinylase-like protein
MDNYPDDFSADAVINEGSFFFDGMLPDGRPLLAISTSEKGLCSLRLTRAGTPGHASVPSTDNALELLIAALERLKGARGEARVTAAMAGWYAGLASVMPFLGPYKANPDDEVLLRLLDEQGVLDNPEQSAALCDTVSITGMRSGGDINVIPDLAVAEVDCRVLPGSSSEAMREWVRGNLDDEHIEIEYVQRSEPSESPVGSECFEAIAEVSARHFDEPLVLPMLLTGTSDSTVFRQRGIDAYGVFPVLIKMTEVKGVHGIDERVSVDNLVRAGDIYAELAERLCVRQ